MNPFRSTPGVSAALVVALVASIAALCVAPVAVVLVVNIIERHGNPAVEAAILLAPLALWIMVVRRSFGVTKTDAVIAGLGAVFAASFWVGVAIYAWSKEIPSAPWEDALLVLVLAPIWSGSVAVVLLRILQFVFGPSDGGAGS